MKREVHDIERGKLHSVEGKDGKGNCKGMEGREKESEWV